MISTGWRNRKESTVERSLSRTRLLNEIKNYLNYLIDEGDELPFEVWMENRRHDISESDMEEISYHARYLAELIDTNCRPER